MPAGSAKTEAAFSVAPDGQGFALPSREDLAWAEARVLAAAQTSDRPVVVVQGLGFVGTAVAAVVAQAALDSGGPRYFVIGVDQLTPSGYWKVARINAGQSPFESPDPGLAPAIHAAVTQAGNLCATVSDQVYRFADVIIVDVPLDVVDRTVAGQAEPQVDLAPFQAAIRAIGRTMRAGALVLVETTVPTGTTEKVVLPILQEEFARRGLAETPRVAHCYERVMPGPRYLDSIRRFWRTYSGIDAESQAQAAEFLGTIIDTRAFPLHRAADPVASELGKLLENSYRAANIAFIHEWTLAAEDLGVNLYEVVDSIRVRRGTHDNMRYPGFGVGGYCLTKDSLLAQWSLKHLFGSDVQLAVTLEALRINYLMPRHALDLLAGLTGGLQGRRIALLGVSYLAEVPDTRNSPSHLFVQELEAAGAQVVAHDPCTRLWPERPDIPVDDDLDRVLGQVDGLVLATPHRAYRQRPAQDWLRAVRPGTVFVDAMNILDDDTALRLHRAGHKVAGVGKGHWRKKGFHQ